MSWSRDRQRTFFVNHPCQEWHHLLRWHVITLPLLLSAGDCIPPHIDHHDFVRPFVTVSLQSEQEILFSERIISLDAGVFSGRFKMPLPPGDEVLQRSKGSIRMIVGGVTLRWLYARSALLHMTKQHAESGPEGALQGIRLIGCDMLGQMFLC